MKRVLAFDIGIKNLAFAVVDRTTQHVLALQQINLLPPVTAVTCSVCALKASYQVTLPYCKRHIPKTHTVLKELTKKLPTLPILKGLAQTYGCVPATQGKQGVLDALATKFAFPYTQPKQANASHVSLEIIHDGLREMVRTHWDLFSTCSHVLLENQPAFTNPHMKSVQVLLYATIREAYLQAQQATVQAQATMQSHVQIRLVHAKKKMTTAPKGDAGYAERKRGSEERLTTLFESGTITGPTFYEAWKKAPKKADMADALCMCMDLE
jgi:hypothetical protein